MVEQRNKCKTRTTKRPAGPAWFCRNLSSLGCSRERTAYQRKSVLHDSTILKILPSYAYQEHIQKQSKTSLSCYFQKHTTGCLSVGARVFIFWCIDMIYDSTLNPLIPVPSFIRLSPEGAKVLLEFLTNFRLCWSLFSTQPALCRAAKKKLAAACGWLIPPDLWVCELRFRFI